MHVKITRTTVADKRFVLAGQVYDLPDQEARALIQLGKAEPATAEAPPAPAEPLTTENTDAIVATDTPKRKGRRV